MILKHLYESQQFTPEILSELFATADKIKSNPFQFSEALHGKLLASLFYEPSTRTRLSFESAMLRLGGEVLGTENAKEFSSAIKGESMEDSIRIIGSYADCIVMRHNEIGAAARAAKVSPVPMINAGDGSGQHPTQALLDVYTIKTELGRLNNFTIAMVGDLAHGRTVRSLCYLLTKFGNSVQIIFVSPPHLKIGEDIKEYLTKHKIHFEESDALNKALTESDIVYMTRIQKERMSPEQYEAAKGKFVINEENLKLVRPKARILHPLPHVEEIVLPVEVEQTDPRVAYFRQAKNGLYTRMALLLHLLREPL
jgi:aspartate carbamoyltransferase catalytic subunit